jgi:hypothetical protein
MYLLWPKGAAVAPSGRLLARSAIQQVQLPATLFHPGAGPLKLKSPKKILQLYFGTNTLNGEYFHF